MNEKMKPIMQRLNAAKAMRQTADDLAKSALNHAKAVEAYRQTKPKFERRI